ncbi:phospholipid scramblase 1-like [Dipodomys merriami]|uniref:phospholipid scramblase 1-like n=1 Tax=Dipodomys merriami TaxID=94247 RepID=UPI0038558DAB
MNEIHNIQQTVQRKSLLGTIANSLPGLECLAEINQLEVCQRFDVDVLCHPEIHKTYDILNSQGHRMYFAEERSSWLLRYLCGSSRPFTVSIYDNVGQEVITAHKALRCHSCFLQKLTVEAPPGKNIGYVCQCFPPLRPKFKIRNQDKEEVMKIKGPCRVSSCLRDIQFNVLSPDEETVLGSISQRGAGCVTHGHKFRVQLPFDLDAKSKATVLAASFLVDYMYFEFCP